jgi:hypothetical protein
MVREPLTEIVFVRMSTEDKAAIVADATEQGLRSEAEWVRARIHEYFARKKKRVDR